MDISIRVSVTLLTVIVVSFCPTSSSYEFSLDTRNQSAGWGWKLRGPYSYWESASDVPKGEGSVSGQSPSPLLRAFAPSYSNSNIRGIWQLQHNASTTGDINNSNLTFEIRYQTSHALFVQGMVTYLAHPAVPLVIASNNKEVGRFWSDAKTWCLATVNLNYHNTFKAEMTTLKVGQYAMVDKIVLGVMANISEGTGQKLKPCLTNPSLPFESNEDPAPDMEVKQETIGNNFRRPPPPDMELKVASSTPKSGLMKGFQTESQGPGGLKCNCQCTCAKPNGTTNTVSSTTSPTRVANHTSRASTLSPPVL